jgi:hypothetical protein
MAKFSLVLFLDRLGNAAQRVVSFKARRNHFISTVERFELKIHESALPANVKQQLIAELQTYKRTVKRYVQIKKWPARKKNAFVLQAVTIEAFEQHVEVLVSRYRKVLTKESSKELLAYAKYIAQLAKPITKRLIGSEWKRNNNLLLLLSLLRKLSHVIDGSLLPEGDVLLIKGRLEDTEKAVMAWQQKWFGKELEGLLQQMGSDWVHLARMTTAGKKYYFGTSWRKLGGRQQAEIEVLCEEIEEIAKLL